MLAQATFGAANCFGAPERNDNALCRDTTSRLRFSLAEGMGKFSIFSCAIAASGSALETLCFWTPASDHTVRRSFSPVGHIKRISRDRSI